MNSFIRWINQQTFLLSINHNYTKCVLMTSLRRKCWRRKRQRSPAVFILTSFLGFAVGHPIFQNHRLVRFEDRLSISSAEQPADLLLEQDASLSRHTCSLTPSEDSRHRRHTALMYGTVFQREEMEKQIIFNSMLHSFTVLLCVPPCSAVRR